MGAATDISNGIKDVLLAAPLGLTFSTGSPGVNPIIMKSVPATPDRVVVISVIPVSDDLSAPSGQVFAQIRCRGALNNALDADDLADSIKPYLHGLKGLTWGSVQLVQMFRNNAVPLGQDSSKRWERADMYTLDVEYPASPLVPDGGTY